MGDGGKWRCPCGVASPGHPVMPLCMGAGLGCGVRVGWTGAGSSSLGNSWSQFPPIDVVARVRGLGGLLAYISSRRAPCARAVPTPGRCACEAMARLTGARPVATHRWDCATAAFLLLLLTVQAGKSGCGRGRHGGVTVCGCCCSCRVPGWGLAVVWVSGDARGRLSTTFHQPSWLLCGEG